MKILIIVSAIIIVPWASDAQLAGIKGGVSLSNYKTQTPWKEVPNMGAAVGVVFFNQLTSNIGLELDLQFIQKGYQHKICNTITDELKANYLEVPVILDYGFFVPGSRKFKVHACAGFYAAFWLSAKYKMKGFDESSETFDFKKNKASRLDVGSQAGGRIEYILNAGSISLDIRYGLGLKDLQQAANDDIRNTNRALVLGITYLKPLSFK